MNKNRDRMRPTFANINLLGKCNADCYFCLGKDISEELKGQNQLSTHFSEWEDFIPFLNACKANNILKLYITGQNTDSLLYEYLEELIQHLKMRGFYVGLRTNGILAKEKMHIIQTCNDEIGYTIHSLHPEIAGNIMHYTGEPIDWSWVLTNTPDNSRMSMVVNRLNVSSCFRNEIIAIAKYLAPFKKVKYLQVRRVSTDTREAQLKPDQELYARCFKWLTEEYQDSRKENYYGAHIYHIAGIDVVLWPTVQTCIDSWNYFTDGTFSKEYFVVEGYLKNKSYE
jgi:MoaA/NifB/PqqE/SkfB family radical SAM enzyme